MEFKESKLSVRSLFITDAPPSKLCYVEKDVILYALGIGALPSELELKFLYEKHKEFCVFPTYLTVAAIQYQVWKDPHGLFSIDSLYHVEHYYRIRKKISNTGCLTSSAELQGVHSTKNGTILRMNVITRDEMEEVCSNEITMYIKGFKDIDSMPTPSKGETLRENARFFGPPHAVHRERVKEGQNCLFRLSGDYTPIHVDPSLAKAKGFELPPIHGLCSLGYAARALVLHFCKDVSSFESIRVSFVEPVFPGETLTTKMWAIDSTSVHFLVEVEEREKIVLRNGIMTIRGEQSIEKAS